MADTTRFAITYLSDAQLTPYVTVNEAVDALDSMGQIPIVEYHATAAPPGSPNNVNLYLVPTSATGAWAGHDGEIARYVTASSAWVFYTALDRMVVWEEQSDSSYILKVWTGSAFEAITETKAARLFPEYPGAVLDTGSGSGTNTGEMTAAYEAVSNDARPYYAWESSEAALQDYDIVVCWKVPEDFDSFAASDALQLRYKTATTSATDQKLDLILQESGSATTSSSTALVSGTSDTWTTEDIANSDTIISGLVAGDILIIRVRLYSKSSNAASAGEIIVNYDRRVI